MPIILDLCGGTGSWSEPYHQAGYDVRIIDSPDDVRLVAFSAEPVHGILAAPPCTHLAVSGARWWAEKGEQALLDALSVADACLRLTLLCKPKWWALENPIGRLSKYYGPPIFIFDPCDFSDPWTKRTCLWGTFNIPKKTPVPITHQKGSSPIHRMPPGPERQKLRSITPAGFARAFFEANP